LSDSHATEVTAALEHEHEGRPELRHHFASELQQRNAASLGMWWFLGTEIMFFGGMFCAYLVYRRWYFPDFVVASRSLSLPIGTFNTTVLICSSLTVAMAVRAAQLGNRKMQVRMLLLTLFFGLSFIGIKGIEWRDKYKEHHIPTFHYNVIGGEGDLAYKNAKFLGLDKLKNDPVALANREAEIQRHTQVFYSLYFALTGMHALHMIIGVGILFGSICSRCCT
jgi:cytochrome c oxidase subunit 3